MYGRVSFDKCLHSCNYQLYHNVENFKQLLLWSFLINPYLHFSTPENYCYIYCGLDLSFPEFYLNGNIPYVVIYVWHLLISLFFIVIHFVACISGTFLSIIRQYSIVKHICKKFINLLMNTLGCFQFGGLFYYYK